MILLSHKALKGSFLLGGRYRLLIANCLPVEDDCSFRVTRPATGYSVHVLRASNWVQTFHKFCSFCQGLQHRCSHASHDSHWTHHIWWVSDLNSNLRQWWANRPHAEWNDVHCATWNMDKTYLHIALKLHMADQQQQRGKLSNFQNLYGARLQASALCCWGFHPSGLLPTTNLCRVTSQKRKNLIQWDFFGAHMVRWKSWMLPNNLDPTMT